MKYYWVVEVPGNIKQKGIVQTGTYNKRDFIREVQMCIGAGMDGLAGPQTLGKTITVSATKNRKHAVVLPLQKFLKMKGYYTDKLDCIAGANFTNAVNRYQRIILGYKKPDGEITKKGRMWKSLLGLIV